MTRYDEGPSKYKGSAARACACYHAALNYSLVASHPTEGSAFLPHCFLQHEKPLHECFWSWGATWNIDVDGNKFIHTLNY